MEQRAAYKIITLRNQRDNITGCVHPGKCRQMGRRLVTLLASFFFQVMIFMEKRASGFVLKTEIAFEFSMEES